jgi:hypothetical protein
MKDPVEGEIHAEEENARRNHIQLPLGYEVSS